MESNVSHKPWRPWKKGSGSSPHLSLVSLLHHGAFIQSFLRASENHGGPVKFVIHWFSGPVESFQKYLALRRILEQAAWLKRLNLGSGYKCICLCIGVAMLCLQLQWWLFTTSFESFVLSPTTVWKANILLSEFCNSLPPVFTIKLEQFIKRGREVFVIFIQFRSVTEHICVQEFAGLQLLLQKIQLRFF